MRRAIPNKNNSIASPVRGIFFAPLYQSKRGEGGGGGLVDETCVVVCGGGGAVVNHPFRLSCLLFVSADADGVLPAIRQLSKHLKLQDDEDFMPTTTTECRLIRPRTP